MFLAYLSLSLCSSFCLSFFLALPLLPSGRASHLRSWMRNVSTNKRWPPLFCSVSFCASLGRAFSFSSVASRSRSVRSAHWMESFDYDFGVVGALFVLVWCQSSTEFRAKKRRTDFPPSEPLYFVFFLCVWWRPTTEQTNQKAFGSNERSRGRDGRQSKPQVSPVRPGPHRLRLRQSPDRPKEEGKKNSSVKPISRFRLSNSA